MGVSLKGINFLNWIKSTWKNQLKKNHILKIDIFKPLSKEYCGGGTP